MNLSRIPGLAAPVPPATGPAAMVGQRPHMDYAGLPEQSMHELAVWSTAGGNGAPQPVKLTVKGADDLLHWSEPFSLKRKYGYFAPNETGTAMINAPMAIEAEYSDGSSKSLQPEDLAYTIATPDGSEAITIGQELQQAWGGRRQLTISYTENDATVSTQLTVMIGEPVTDDMKLRFKIGVEIPEAARKDVIPELEANRIISRASARHLNNGLLFNVKGDVLSIDPVASCFDATTGQLMSGWLFKTGINGRPTGAYYSIYLLCEYVREDGDPTSPSYYITEVLSDPDHAWAVTDGLFRYSEFCGWKSLQYGLVEETGTTAYVDRYRCEQYIYCSQLKGFKNADGDVVEHPEEATGVTPLVDNRAADYRAYQFKGCSSLVTPLVEHSPSIEYSLVDIINFRGNQYCGCNSLLAAADEDPLPVAERTDIFNFRYEQYAYCTAMTKSAVEHTYDFSGTVIASKASSGGFRAEQYYGCTALKPSGVEKMLEKLTGTSGSGMTRDNKYAVTGVTDVTPFYYQDNGTGDPTPALQRDTYEPADGKYIHQYTMYGGHATTGWKIEASTDSTWKSTYQEGELFTLTGLTVDVYTNDGKIKSFNSSQISDSNSFRVTPQPNTIIGTGTSKVTISYQAYTSDPVVSVSLPITVTPAPPEA